MVRYPFYFRLFVLAALLPYVAINLVPKGAWHWAIMLLAVGLLAWGVVLMYLRKTGRSTWNGPRWKSVSGSSAQSRRVLMLVSVLCAATIPVLLLLNEKWRLSDSHIGFACGVLLGISLTAIVKLRSRAQKCAAIDGPAESSGTE